MSNDSTASKSRSGSKRGSTRRTDRPKKPYKDFPLSPHALGKWCKKIGGKFYYFGNWGKRIDGKLVPLPDGGWKNALALYLAQRDDLHAGRTPRKVADDALTVAGACNEFLTSRLRKRDAGEITERTFGEYNATTDRIVATFGGRRAVDDLRPADFAKLRADVARTWGPIRLKNEITRIRSVFRFAFETGTIDKPVRFGPEFVAPSKAVLRRAKAERPARMFEASEIRALLDAASVPVRAMILLGINAALGNADIGGLPRSAIDLSGGWLRYARRKTGIMRAAKLWPETIEAVREALAERPDPKDAKDDRLVFVSRFGRPWVTDAADSVSTEFRKLLRKTKLAREGRSFYGLRHTSRTVMDEVHDLPAIRLVMGHTDGSIDAVYRERIDDARLVRVAEHVRGWLFSAEGGAL